MTKTEFDKLSNKIWESIMTTRNQGQNEYARTETDVLANFKRIGEWKNETQESVLLTFMLKHIDGIIAYVNGYKSQREDIRGRITDIIVYCMLLWSMVEEHDNKVGS